MSDNENKEVQVFDDEKDVLLNHEYDGIKEFNHPLPGWWLKVFYLTMVYALVYYVYMTFMGGKSIDQELTEDLKTLEAIQLKNKDNFDQKFYATAIAHPKYEKKSKKLYKRKCKACHGKFGQGSVGPNLTDKFWINGDGTTAAVYKVIAEGVPDKGMEAWGKKLKKEQVYMLTKYVMDMKGTNPEGGKEPQGKEYP